MVHCYGHLNQPLQKKLLSAGSGQPSLLQRFVAFKELFFVKKPDSFAEKSLLRFSQWRKAVRHQKQCRPGETHLFQSLQIFVNSVKRKLQTVGYAQLVEYVVQMVLHRLLADEHPFSDFFIAETLRDETHNLFFTEAERRRSLG